MKIYDTPDLTVITLDDLITTSREWDTEEMPIGEKAESTNFVW